MNSIVCQIENEAKQNKQKTQTVEYAIPGSSNSNCEEMKSSVILFQDSPEAGKKSLKRIYEEDSFSEDGSPDLHTSPENSALQGVNFYKSIERKK